MTPSSADKDDDGPTAADKLLEDGDGGTLEDVKQAVSVKSNSKINAQHRRGTTRCQFIVDFGPRF